MRNPREELVLVMCFCLAAGLACAEDYDNAYLEATDGQVINTRYFVKDSTRFEIDYRFVETNGQVRCLYQRFRKLQVRPLVGARVGGDFRQHDKSAEAGKAGS